MPRGGEGEQVDGSKNHNGPMFIAGNAIWPYLEGTRIITAEKKEIPPRR
jgi:hypothetical protein